MYFKMNRQFISKITISVVHLYSDESFCSPDFIFNKNKSEAIDVSVCKWTYASVDISIKQNIGSFQVLLFGLIQVFSVFTHP